MNIYLYKKTHNITGLKYLGKTTAKDPHKYKGSGDYWKDHIKTHGYDVTTEILAECKTTKELKERGLYYSNLWNVVEEKDANGKKTWANLRPETSDGGGRLPGFKLTDSHKENISIAKTDVTNPKLSEQRKGFGNHMFGQKRDDISGDNNPMKDPAIADRVRRSHLGKKHTDESKRKRSEKLSGHNNPMFGKIGEHSPRYGKTSPPMTCEHCSKTCARHNFVKYHGDKCKNKNNRI